MHPHALTYTATPQRVKILRVNAQAFLDMLKGMDGTIDRGVVTCSGLPDDAKAVGLIFHCERNEFGVIVESAEFPECPEGYAMEWMNVTFSVFTDSRIQLALADALDDVRDEQREDAKRKLAAA